MANTTAKTFQSYLDGQKLFDIDPSNGKIIPNTSDVLDAWKTILSNMFDGNLYISEENPAGRLVEAIATMISRFCSITCAYANQVNPRYATGIGLDAIGSMFNVPRNGATNTTIYIQVYGNPNTIITAGSKIENNIGQQFVISSDIVIPESGTTTGFAESIEFGNMEIENGSVTKIVDKISGWNAVTNLGVTNAGYNIESDAKYRKRILESRWVGVSFVNSIHTNVLKISGVKSVRIAENFDSTIKYIDSNGAVSDDTTGIPIAAHSVFIVVDYDGSDDTKNKIGKAIYENKSAGCGYSTQGEGVIVSVLDESNGVSYTVKFNDSTKKEFKPVLNIKANKYTGTDDNLKDEIETALLNWANGNLDEVEGLSLGNDVNAFEIASAISHQIPDVTIHSVVLRTNEADTSNIEIKFNEVGSLLIDKSLITITR